MQMGVGAQFAKSPGGTSTPPGLEQTALARAQALLGTTINTCLYDDFFTDQLYAASRGGTGTDAPSLTARAGVLTGTTGATAGSFDIIFPHGTPSFIDNPKTTRWYARFRFRATTAVDAQAVLTCELASVTSGDPVHQIGVHGTVSAAFFSCRVTDNGAVVRFSQATTVAVDTNFHTWEMWCDTSTLFFAIDGVQVASSGNGTFGTNPVRLTIRANNGTTAAARAYELDSWALCVASN